MKQKSKSLKNVHRECKDHSKLLSGILSPHLETVSVNGGLLVSSIDPKSRKKMIEENKRYWVFMKI